MDARWLRVVAALAAFVVATAVGILVAIPAVVAYNMLSRRAQRVEENVERLCNILIANIDRSSREGGKK